ncbi:MULTISPECIES: alpha/beta fold hydrolase [unclassified Pseudofrankia]|uniref:alpha/beta fold hydrolase n=1 Tax=unclassified Pseudofrankia TaxID=2994372 RepID=UPI0008D9A9A1|nr:esterase [Pseudofrankia sp. BMG5.36]
MRFVLVHGGFHGAWCWGRTIPELERLGHGAIAVDVPGHGERVHEEATMENRLEAVVSVLEPNDVLVGHSGGGFEITRAADARPELVSHVIYLAAALPVEGRSGPDSNAMKEDGTVQRDLDVTGMLGHLRFDDDGSMSFADFQGAWDFFYHDCDEETARWAFERLTPEKLGDISSVPMSVPTFWAAGLPRSFILCLQDRSQPRWLADLVARRLGVEPLTIDASHSPFLSRPAELAELLVHATTTKPVGSLRPVP